MGVFSELKPKNSARKNPFDLSSDVTINQKCGMVVPLKYWPTLPNSEYQLDIKSLIRTQPLATAAFAGFSINYDVVWTPYNDHYSSFNQFIAQRLNKQHTTQPDINDIPKFDLGKFVRLVLAFAVYDSFCADYGYQKYHEDLVNLTYQVPWYFGYSENLPEESLFLSCLRNLDMLEYGNYLGYLKLIKAAIVDYLDNKLTYTVPADKNLPYHMRYLALLEKSNAGTTLLTSISGISAFSYQNTMVHYLELVDKFLFESDPTSHPLLSYYYDIHIDNNIVADQFVDLWPIQTYNKAFWQFYRNEYYDTQYNFFLWQTTYYSKYNEPYVNLFNYDDYTTALVPYYRSE